MYIEYRCPPRAPVANLINVFKRDISSFEQQHNIKITVTSDQAASTIRLTFEKASYVTLFLMSHKPRTYTTSWHRVVNTCT